MTDDKRDSIESQLYGPGADTHNRMEICLRLMSHLPRRDAYQLLGRAWPACDTLWQHKDEIIQWLDAAERADLDAMMTPEALTRLAELPERFTVWRGCTESNIKGLSWVLEQDAAAGFAHRNERRKENELTLLVGGTVSKEDAALVFDDGVEVIIAAHVDIWMMLPLSEG